MSEMNRLARSVDIADFRVGQHVLFCNGNVRCQGILIEITPEHTFPALVAFNDGSTVRANPWELTSCPASRSIDDVERWLNER